MKEDTFQRVAAYADRILFEEDRVVSANEIKSAIGGGTDQVRQAHAAWMVGLADRLRQTESIPELPPSLSKALVEAWRDSVETAREQARAALVEHEKRADSRVAALEQDGLALRANLETKETEVTTAKRRIDEAEAVLRTRDNELAAEQARVEAAERRTLEQRETAERLAQQAQAQLASLREQLGIAHERHDALERRLVSQLDEQKIARAGLERQLAENDAQWRAFEKETQMRYTVLAESHIRLQSERDALQKQLTVSNERLTELDAQCHCYALEQAVLTQKLDASNATYQNLAVAYQTAQEIIIQLQTELTVLRTEQRLWEHLTRNEKRDTG